MGMQVTDGELTQVFRLAEQGSPTMGLYDKDGKVRVRLGLAAEGSPVLRLLDADGECVRSWASPPTARRSCSSWTRRSSRPGRCAETVTDLRYIGSEGVGWDVLALLGGLAFLAVSEMEASRPPAAA